MSSDFSDTINCLPKLCGFKMAFLNIVSLPKRFDEINFTMSNKLLDIMSFSDTRLNSTIPDSMIRIDDYDIIRKDRSRSGGGVCIYIRNTINYQIRHDLSPPVLEVICIEISKPHSRPFIVIVVYRPPDASPDFFIHLENLLKKIDNENKGIYILGDLNCDLIKPNPDNPTKKQSLLEIYQLSQLVDTATRITMNSSTLIDHFITNEPDKISKFGVIHTGISDHSLIYGIRKTNINHKNNGNIITIRNMRKFDEGKFLYDLGMQSWEYVYFFADNPSTMWEIWKDLFLQILDKHVPLQSKKIKSKRSPWITSHIKNLFTRDDLKRKAIITKLDTDWEMYKKARNETNTKLKQAKTDYFYAKISANKQNPKAAWKTINTLFGKHYQPSRVNELNVNDIKLTKQMILQKVSTPSFPILGQV